MKKLIILLALAFVACGKQGALCLYEKETTNYYPPARSFKSYYISAQYRYCSNDQQGAIRLVREYENTPDNLSKINEDYTKLIEEESSRDCSKETK